MQPVSDLHSYGQYPHFPPFQHDLVKDTKSVRGTAAQFPRRSKGSRSLLERLSVARPLVWSKRQLLFDSFLQKSMVSPLNGLYMGVNLRGVKEGVAELFTHRL